MQTIPFAEYDQSGVKQMLGQIPFFADLSAHGFSEYELLLKSAEVCTLLPGEALLSKGDISSLFYVLLQGQLDVFADVDPGDSAISQLGAGQVIGALGALNNDQRTATLASSRDEKSTLLVLDFSVFGELEDFSRIHMMTKIRLYRNVVNNIRWKLETYKKATDDPTLAQELKLHPPFSGEKNSIHELRSLAEQSKGLACLLDSWNECTEADIPLPELQDKNGIANLFSNVRERLRF